jgi:tetratricopeptide (TPR) repeat protein
MPGWKWNQARLGLPLLWQVASVLWLSASPLAAQELPLKRDIPGSTPYQCPAGAVAAHPGEAERAQARQIAATAAQAVILGDLQRARSLLDRATELDPSSEDLAYRHARVLEEVGDHGAAMSEYCRALAIDPKGAASSDARDRLDALVAADRPAIPEVAIKAFQDGLTQADAGRLERAAAAFDSAATSAPEWAEAIYDRGVAYARLGRTSEATRDLRKYLELEPDASDAITVSQRIGVLQSLAVVGVPSSGTALALGLLIPGMGQFYSGRAIGGLTVLSLAGGSIAAGLLIRKVTVKCLSDVPPGGTCPAGQVLGHEVGHPYRVAGLGAAAAVSAIGAIEAFVKLRRRRSATQEVASIDLGRARVGTLEVSASGGRLDLQLVRLVF